MMTYSKKLLDLDYYFCTFLKILCSTKLMQSFIVRYLLVQHLWLGVADYIMSKKPTLVRVKRKVSRPKKSEDVKRLKDPSILLELKFPFVNFLYRFHLDN